MELVMLGKIDKEDLLSSVDEKKSEERKRGDSTGCNLTIYDPTSSSKEAVDRIVLERLEELKKQKTRAIESETAERGKFNNALTFTDIPATVKKGGFHSDGSPCLAVAGLFDKKVDLVREGGKLKYHSSLRVEFGDVKIDKKEMPCFLAALTLSTASFFIPFFTLSSLHGYFGSLPPGIVFSTMFGGFIPIVLTLFYVFTIEEFGKIELSPGNWIEIRLNISTPVPSVPECVLEKMCENGKGPFAILFEVSEGWKKIEPDPVILRVITIGDKQFFEPVIGYDMTPLEKSSLVET